MTSVLRKNGIGANVSAVRVILSKELPYSSVHRLAVECQGAGPRSLFLKLTRSLTDGKAPAGIGQKEVEFYQTVARGINCPPLIRCYDAEFSDETGRAHILMDDLFETHMQPKQKTTPSEEMSRRAVEALAEVHSAIWDVGFGIADVGRFNHEKLKKFIGDLRESVRRFLEVADLTAAQVREYGRMLDAADLIWGRLLRPDHLTVTHGDMHWWNFLFPKDPSAHSVHIFDWHLWHVDLGARDLAFLLALGGFAEPRPSLEEDLLRAYHDALSVEGYSWEMLMEDYRWSAIRNLNIPVIFWSQGKHESTWKDALRRAYAAYERLGCAELIS